MEPFVGNETVDVCGKTFRLLCLLGHGKGGYSYLAMDEDQKVVLKQIHHEPCDYYHFGNKIEAEANDYQRLQQAGIRIPKMLLIDRQQEIIIKEYIPGETAFDCLCAGKDIEPYLGQVREMADQARACGLNIDYFPTNFIIHDGLLWYVDYECNTYMEEWNFENWGRLYWSDTPEFREYLQQHSGMI